MRAFESLDFDVAFYFGIAILETSDSKMNVIKNV